ncbi:hypothetical protein ANANG_G00050380 [Anguilla anguilla]|uniref:SI1L3 protein n=1 Tax=Anguilla anguilla TaxID=7936 RepID=A0A9D3MYV4_ANGAN|nr:hypothetical protein ANANG_G00050380 [Anguilla anguilla]
MQSDDLFNKKLRALNGNMGPPTSNVQGTPAMPKMGVRARVSEWPPRKEAWEGRPPPNYESLMIGYHNGQSDESMEVNEQGGRVGPDPELPDAKYLLGDLLDHASPLKMGLHPIRQRSNSDVTISDIDAEDLLDQNAVNPNTGASLHREYGSTSSIDRQGLGVGDVGFFTLLKGYRVDPLDHRAVPPLGFPELLRYDTAFSPSLHTAAQIAAARSCTSPGWTTPTARSCTAAGGMGGPGGREKSFMRRFRSSEGSETSLFRKLRTIKSESDGLLRLSSLGGEPAQDDRRAPNFQKCFAHYDVQSVLFNIGEAVANRANLGRRKNTTTGRPPPRSTRSPAEGRAGAGRGGRGAVPACESPLGSREDLNSKENPDADEGDGKSNGLVLSCPYFRNEIGGEGERRISLSRANAAPYSAGENCSFESSLSSHCTNAGVSVLEVPRENQPIHREKVKRYIIEHIDLGAYYYHKYFYNREHQNYF